MGKFEGEDLVVGIGKFGAYVRHDKTFASLDKKDDPYTISYERAVELLNAHKAQVEAANTPIKTFPENPDLVIKNGRYGAYIAYRGKNYRLPKGVKPAYLVIEDCLKIINSSKK